MGFIYFEPQEQKEDCLNALKNSITMWQKILGYAEKGENISKEKAVMETLQKGICGKKIPVPANMCFLCQYVKEQTWAHCATATEWDEAYRRNASGFDCEIFCPVIWDKKHNPENMDLCDNDGYKCTPCEYGASPYDTYNKMPCTYGNNKTKYMDRLKTILKQMIRLLEQSLKDAKNTPVRNQHTA